MTQEEAEKFIADRTEPEGAIEITSTTTAILIREAFEAGRKSMAADASRDFVESAT